MRIIFTVFFCLLLGLPFVVKANAPMMFADASSSIFRFQYKLAEQGNAEAQYKVGEMYELGRGVEKNREKAREWYTMAAKQGHPKSKYRLLFLDIQKSGMNVERKQQLDQLQKEASTGVGDAQYFLGRMYAAGVGLPKSYENAQSWLSKATFNGIPEAETDLIAVQEEIARIQVRQKQREAEAERKKAEAEKARKEREARAAREKDLAAKREAEKRAAARREAERLQREREAAAAAQRQQKQRARPAEPKPEPATDVPEVDENAVFESDPCKGKKAKFLSICK
jgi:TPR repeat protein